MGKNWDQIQRSFQVFCDGTSMHGFVELFYAKNICWVAFWLILLSSAIGLTMYQVTRSVNQFMDQTSNSRTEIVPENDMYPPLKLCSIHWVYWLDWDKAYSLKFTKESILYGMSYLTEIYTKDIFNVQEAKNDFKKAMLLNNFTKIQQFYQSVAKDLNRLVESSYNPAFDQREIFVSKYWGPIVCNVMTGKVIQEAVRVNMTSYDLELVFYLPSQNELVLNSEITTLEYSWYMSQFLTNMGIYNNNATIHSQTDFSNFQLPLLLYIDGYSQECMLISDEHDLYLISVTVIANRWRSRSNFTCLENARVIATNLTFRPSCPSLYPDIVCKCQYLSDTIQTNTDEPNTLCQNQIFRVENLSSTIVFPGILITNPNDCWENETSKQLQQLCPTPVDPCERWKYTFSFTAQSFGTMDVRKYLKKTGIIVRLVYPSDYEIFLTIEEEQQTWEDFVANVGGLLGVWTGASLLSIIQLFYLCCFSHIEPKKSLKTKSNNNVITIK